ncbi:cell division protein PerM [Nocardia thailandica]
MSARNALVRRTSGSPGGGVTATGTPEPPDSGGRSPLSLSPERARLLLLVAARPSLCVLAVLTVLVLLTLLTTDTGMSGAPAVIAASWLGAHQIPLTIGRTTLGLLPLVPTAAILWFAARETARAVPARPTRVDLAWLAGATLAGPLLVTAVCLAVTADASGVTPLQPPGTLAAFGWVLLLYAATAATAFAGRHWRAVRGLLPVEVPEWAMQGLRAARRTVLRLLACAAVATLVGFLAHLSRFGDAYGRADGFVDVLGTTVLSLAYLPNVVVGAAGLLSGAAIQFGSGSVGLFGVLGAQAPAVPALIPLPTGPAAAWWPALALIPIAIGVLGGVELGRVSDDRAGAPWATFTSAGVATLTFLALSFVAGGELGAFGHVGTDLLMLAALLFTWFGVGGYAGMLFARRFLAPSEAVAAVPSDDYDDYDDDAYDDAGAYDDGTDGAYDEYDEYDDDPEAEYDYDLDEDDYEESSDAYDDDDPDYDDDPGDDPDDDPDGHADDPETDAEQADGEVYAELLDETDDDPVSRPAGEAGAGEQAEIVDVEVVDEGPAGSAPGAPR